MVWYNSHSIILPCLCAYFLVCTKTNTMWENHGIFWKYTSIYHVFLTLLHFLILSSLIFKLASSNNYLLLLKVLKAQVLLPAALSHSGCVFLSLCVCVSRLRVLAVCVRLCSTSAPTDGLSSVWKLETWSSSWGESMQTGWRWASDGEREDTRMEGIKERER